MTDYDSEIPASSFIRIGQSLEMPGEIDDKLKRVPKKSWTGDKRRPFFIENANSQKYYYMPIGDFHQHPHRNTLVPLGTFLGFIDYRPAPGGYGRIQVMDGSNWTEYYMRFSNPPFNTADGAISMETHPLVYTETSPVAGSIPLTYKDYIREFYPEQLTEGGKKTKKYRKNPKKNKTNKKIRNIKNKRQNVKNKK
jgi:hypothetical protein